MKDNRSKRYRELDEETVNSFQILVQKIDGFCYIEDLSNEIKLGMSLKEKYNINMSTGRCITKPANHDEILTLVEMLISNIQKMSLEWRSYWLNVYDFDWAWSFIDDIDWNFFIYTDYSDLRSYHIYELINKKALLISTKMFERLAKDKTMSAQDLQICQMKRPID